MLNLCVYRVDIEHQELYWPVLVKAAIQTNYVIFVPLYSQSFQHHLSLFGKLIDIEYV